MESAIEAIGYALILRPVQAAAIGVFLYRAVAALVGSRTRGADPAIPARRLAVPAA